MVKDMQENFRLIAALESAGWTAQEIIDLIKYVGSGDERYKPHPKKNTVDGQDGAVR